MGKEDDAYHPVRYTMNYAKKFYEKYSYSFHLMVVMGTLSIDMAE